MLIGRGARARSVSSAQCPSGVMVTRPRLWMAAPKSTRGSTAAARGSVFVRQLRRTSATVRLGTEATVERVLADRPDAVVVATGAVPRRPDVPGVDLPGVVTVEDILSGTAVAGTRVVVVDGTGRIQAGLAADFLAVQGRAVSVLTAYHTVCDNTEGSTKEPLFERLYQRDVAMIVDTAIVATRPRFAPRFASRMRRISSARRAASSASASGSSTGFDPLLVPHG